MAAQPNAGAVAESRALPHGRHADSVVLQLGPVKGLPIQKAIRCLDRARFSTSVPHHS